MPPNAKVAVKRPLSKWPEVQVVRFLDLSLSGRMPIKDAIALIYEEFPESERYAHQYHYKALQWFKAKKDRLANYWSLRKREAEGGSFGRAENRLLGLIQVAEKIFWKLDREFDEMSPKSVSDLASAFRTTLAAIKEEVDPGMESTKVMSAFEGMMNMVQAASRGGKVPFWARGMEEEFSQWVSPTKQTPSN